MEDLALKIRLAVLWLFMAVATSALMVLCFMIPGFGEEIIIAGEFEGMQISEGFLLILALFWWIPLTLALLSLTLKDSTYRWASIIAGIFFAGFSIISLGGHLIQGWLALSLMEGSKIVVAALIVWYAWKWPKQGA